MHVAGRADLAPIDPGVRPTNLPVQLTTFVGREREREEVKRLLADVRLLTLTGAGGVGKTRLALEVAAELVDPSASSEQVRFAGQAYPDGVWLVELASVADPALVPQIVASALNVGEVPDEPLIATVTSALRPGQHLLVLDNCEHLAAACAELADRLLRGCPRLQILTTSREPLGVPGETVWGVPPLSVPDPRVTIGTDEIAGCEAVRLFVDRARSIRPAFVLEDRNAAAVAEICRQLDGIPLAIELAAARLRSLGVEEIAERLDDRFRLLTMNTRTALPRQQTLRATVDWSYEMLPEPERRTLRQLTVFAGGWALEAAQAVVGSPESVVQDTDTRAPAPVSSSSGADGGVLDHLTRLVDRCLVQADEQCGRVRYRLLETIRQYAAEKARDAHEEAALRARHCDWFLALADQAGLALRGPEQAAWVERLELEHDNLRAALGWTVEAGDAERGLRLGRALWRFWSYRGYLIEGRRWLDAVLSLTAAANRSAMYADVLFAAGRLAHQQGDYAAARPLFERSLNIAGQVGHREVVAGALTQLGHLAVNADDYDAARDCYVKALAHRHQLGDTGEVAVGLAGLAYVTQVEGHYDRAGELYDEALTIVEALGDRSLVAYVVCRLGELALDQGRYAEARSRLEAGLAIYQTLGARTRLPGVLEGFAALAAARGQSAGALRLAGAAAALRDAIAARPSPRESTWLCRGLEPARVSLGERASTEQWELGRAASLEQAIAEALGEDAHEPNVASRDAGTGKAAPATAPRQPSDPPDERSGPLSPREREVAILIGRGRTNREIAEALVISERTAETHVTHVLGKLGFRSRAQVAVWAMEHGLLEPAGRR